MLVSELSQTPPKLLRAHDDPGEIKNQISSEKSGINYEENVCYVMTLPGEICSDRSIGFH